MSNLKYKVGDKVLIKSIGWYNENKDADGNIVFYSKVSRFSWRENVRTTFTKDMAKFCGKVVTIETVFDVNYSIVEGTNIDYFTDEMIEGLADETPKFKGGDKITNGKIQLRILKFTSDKYIVEDIFGECGTLYFNTQDYWKLVEEENNDCEKCGLNHNSIRCLFMDNCPHNKQKNIIEIPDGYVVKDENDNVINAQKIVLEKKTEYPKTYEECCQYLGCDDKIKLQLIGKFMQLINARNAYWKIAGEEMGLGKPWEPTMETVYCISRNNNVIKCSYRGGKSNVLEFPTEEMRDAFYENFKKEIEECKELL